MTKSVLLGYGTIGKGVEDLAKQVPDLEITNVFVLPEFVDEPYFTNDGMGLVTHPETEIVFECLSGVEPANTLIRAALENGKHVITSNKAVVSQNMKDYIDLAAKNGGSIEIEASVAGGIPFLDALLRFKRLEDLNGYEGIFNGTGNYILDKMQKDGLSPEEALKQAQEKGYAEFDPTNDVEGIDAWYKAIIANALAYDAYEMDLKKPIGISKINEADIEAAKKLNKIIRHLVVSKQEDKGFDTLVIPAFLNPEDYLANVPANYNAQLIFADSFDKLGYFGQGAGRYPTAQAMVHNAIDLMDGRELPIVLDDEMHYQPGLIKENLIIRSGKDLSELKLDSLKSFFKEGEESYYLLNNGDAFTIEKIREFDPEAMIALWR